MKENIRNPKDLSISEAVLESARENPRKTALTYMNVKINYKKLLRKVEELSIAFFSLGVRKGDKALVVLPNIPQCVYCLYALNRLGAVPAFVSPLASVGEIQTYIEKLRPKVIIALDSLSDKLEEIDYMLKETLVVLTSPFDELLPFSFTGKSENLNWHQLLKGKASRNIFISPQRTSDTALILFSGGTTGRPKAVEISNGNLNSLAEGTASACVKEVRGVKMLSALPMFHGFGLGICVHTVLYFGGNALLMPRFVPSPAGRLIAKEKPQYLACVPAMLKPLMESKALKKADLSCLWGVFSGGDSLPAELEESFDNFLACRGAKVSVRQGYGLTECVAATCLIPEGVKKPDCIGKPYDETMYKIVGETSCGELLRGKVGEICISGATVMKGYFEDDEETSKVLRIHSDGKLWLHTGDMGYMDAEGFVYFKGRLKRLIVTNGNNVFPSEIEKALLTHPKVSECCAVGVKDDEKISAVAVFAVLKNHADSETSSALLKAQLMEHLEKFVSKTARPKYIYFVESLPKTPLGKTDFSALERIADTNIK